MQVIGLMSGTSLDGVDAATLETDGERITGSGPALTIFYDDQLRADLRQLLELAPAIEAGDEFLLDVERRLTLRHVEAVRALGRGADLIGFPGQTILHRPEERRTWQIGDATLLARETGVPVATQFRLADVAAGGQGAPFAPIFHAALAHGLPKPLAVLNLGGVANVTWIGADGRLVACDTGPGNALLDDWAARHLGQRMDTDGALALAGVADPAILATLLANEWLERPAPKSLDRLDFSHALEAVGGLSAADGAATLTEFSARAVAATRLPAPPVMWLVCGGGRHNPAMMAALQAAFQVPVEPVERQGWDGDAVEAQCFAYLAARVLRGLPLSFPETTGVPVPMAGGMIVQP